MPRGMWDLSSPDQGLNPRPLEWKHGVLTLNHWTTREVLGLFTCKILPGSQKHARKGNSIELRGNHLLFDGGSVSWICSFAGDEQETKDRTDGGTHSTSSASLLLFTFWYLKVYANAVALKTWTVNDLFLLSEFPQNCAQGFPGGAVVESPPANAGEAGSGPGPGGSHMPRSG